MIVLMAGLPGTGKSTLARGLASRVDGAVLSKDEIRHAILLSITTIGFPNGQAALSWAEDVMRKK